MNERTKLNNEQIAALQEVVGGADVAKLLREIEVIAPELIEIGHPMGVYKAIDPHPYFGAIVPAAVSSISKISKNKHGMNKKQREIITDAYEQYIRNAMRGDPVGGFSDFADLFSRLRETDKRLDEELQERYDEIPDK